MRHPTPMSHKFELRQARIGHLRTSAAPQHPGGPDPLSEGPLFAVLVRVRHRRNRCRSPVINRAPRSNVK